MAITRERIHVFARLGGGIVDDLRSGKFFDADAKAHDIMQYSLELERELYRAENAEVENATKD